MYQAATRSRGASMTAGTSGANTRSAWPSSRRPGTAAPSSPAVPSASLPACSPGAVTRCCRATSPRRRSVPPPSAPGTWPHVRVEQRDIARQLAVRPLRPHRVLRDPVLLRGPRPASRSLNNAVACPRAGRHAARGALAASRGRLSALRRRRPSRARGAARAGPPGRAHRARLPGRGVHPHRGDAGFGGPGDGPGCDRSGASASWCRRTTRKRCCPPAWRRCAEPPRRPDAGARAGGRRCLHRPRQPPPRRPAGPG